MIRINTVTVVGANGTMGRNISAIFASFGNTKVYMVSRTKEKSTDAISKAYKTVRAESVKNNMIPADYNMLDECINKSDLVFECTAENLDIKAEIIKKIDSCMNETTICCTGTSGLSINTLSENFSEKNKKNFMGVHMFNPPYNMTLCEMIQSKYTDKKVFYELKKYMIKVLRRTVVEVKDYPAFLGNRIGFNFINEALINAEKYKYSGGIDYIDAILGPFTGRAMAPLVTANYVGLDVHKAIVDNLYINTDDYSHSSFKLPGYVDELVQNGKLGRKSNGGLYRNIIHDSGMKIHQVYDIESKNYRDIVKYSFPFVESIIKYLRIGDYDKAFYTLINNGSIEAELCMEFILKYILYSLKTTALVGYDIHAADDVMATGFNWCPPLAMIDALLGVENFKSLVKERINGNILEDIDLELLLSNFEQSRYDFRKFIKAK